MRRLPIAPARMLQRQLEIERLELRATVIGLDVEELRAEAKRVPWSYSDHLRTAIDAWICGEERRIP